MKFAEIALKEKKRSAADSRRIQSEVNKYRLRGNFIFREGGWLLFDREKGAFNGKQQGKATG
jgi:hypothetical protein